MRSSYNYTVVERHKQKLFIPYLGVEFSGWTTLLIMLFGVIIGVFIFGTLLSKIIGTLGYFLAIILVGTVEMIGIMLLTEIDREAGKSKLYVFYYTSIKNYRIVYDKYGNKHFLSKRKRGVIYRVC